MIFSSWQYILFFCTVLVLMRVLRWNAAKKWVLLGASYFFYGWWDYRFLALILSMTAANYFMGTRIATGTDPKARKRWVTAAVIFNLVALGFFKYFNFFVGSADALLAVLNVRIPFMEIILPVGISFITFEVMSYTIDIYRGAGMPAKSFLDMALLVSFFPHLIAGPILKPRQFLPQFDREITIRWANMEAGAQMFLVGLVKKVVIADRLSAFSDAVFQSPGLYNTPTVWLAAISYSIQIYCDFSAYSDMGIGSAKCLGFEIPRNFNLPYVSKNITEFWRRWHISLSTWLRDYLYISLGGNRRGVARRYANLMITMLLGGLWHGASWNFVAWGGLHGLGLVVHRLFTDRLGGKKLVPGYVGMVASQAVTLVFVCILWVFFRARDFSISTLIVKKMFFLGDTGGVAWYPTFLLFAVIAVTVNHLIGNTRGEYPTLRLNTFTGMFVVIFTLLGIFFLSPAEISPFIYFQF